MKRVLDASPEERNIMVKSRADAAVEYHRVINLVDEAKAPQKRGLFRRARSAPR
jgi:hypothetical protein